MKTSLIMGAALAILGVAAAPLIAQTQTTTSSTSTGYVQTSKIIGTKVKVSNGEEVGVVKDVVLDRNNGCMAYTVLSTGGTGTRITGGGKLVAVPWSVYTGSPDAGYLTVNVERDRIYNAPIFEYSRISDTTYTSNIYSHFGVSAGATLQGSTTTGRETTGAAANTTSRQTSGTTANPNDVNNPPPPAAGPSASASPGSTASMTPAASATPGTSPSASAAGTVPPDAKATASPKSGTKGHSRTGESTASSRHQGEEASQGTSGESSEASGTSSGKKSARKNSSDESNPESSGSPSSKKSSHKRGGSEGSSEAAPTPEGEQE